jgi:UV DNA damage endonuclease
MITENTNLGYCCINMTLQKDKKSKITTNRSMIKKTFAERGIAYASELALLNVRDLVEIIKWNHKNGIKVYRMSSDIFPWMSEYELKDLPDYRKISTLLAGAGALAQKYGQRLGFHPGHFNVLASKNSSVVAKTIKELNQHAEVMDLMGLPRNHYAAINIHVNTTQGGKDESLKRFCVAFEQLDDAVKSRLVVENDDKESQYTVEDLYMGIWREIGTPITFDYHHHWCHPGALTQEGALKLAAKTWGNIKQLTHFSSCKTIHEDANQTNKRAHADYIYDEINDYGLSIDIEVEAKAKELAVQKYMKHFQGELV